MGEKDKTTAGIFGILLGAFGAHKFYLGKTGQGILYALFFWTYIPGIVGLIEGIRYLIMDEDEFQRKYGDAETAAARDKPRRICVECGMEIEPDFNACPHCGALVKKGPTRAPAASGTPAPNSSENPSPDRDEGDERDREYEH